MLDSFLEENGYYLGTNITIEDNTTKDEGVQLNAMVMSQVYTQKELSGYDTSSSNVTGFADDGFIGEGDLVTGMAIYGNSSNFYYDNTKSNGLVKAGLDSNSPVFVSENGKTTTEMQSAAFVDELNSHLPKPAFRQDPDGGTPILAGGNATINYDGYVKKSEFESFKKNMPTSTVKPNDFIYELKSDVYGFTSNTPSEDISTAIGGEEGMKAIIQAIKDGYRFVIRGTLESFTIGTINTELNVWFYKETDSGDLHVGFGGIAAYMFGGVASNIAISYTKSSSTFKVEVITA